MPIINSHTGQDFYRETTTTISEDKGYTTVKMEDRAGITTIKFRNCSNNQDSTLQFECQSQPFGKRGKYFSFSIPGPLVETFITRLRVPYSPQN